MQFKFEVHPTELFPIFVWSLFFDRGSAFSLLEPLNFFICEKLII